MRVRIGVRVGMCSERYTVQVRVGVRVEVATEDVQPWPHNAFIRVGAGGVNP